MASKHPPGSNVEAHEESLQADKMVIEECKCGWLVYGSVWNDVCVLSYHGYEIMIEAIIRFPKRDHM